MLGHNQHYSNGVTGLFTPQVIADTTRRMGAGMAKYIQQDVESVADYDEYCHFVAGLVGAGLSQASLGHQLLSEVSPYMCSRKWRRSQTDLDMHQLACMAFCRQEVKAITVAQETQVDAWLE